MTTKKEELTNERTIEDELLGAIPFILAGLQGHTDGNRLTSFTVQQDGLGGFRVIIRGIGSIDGADEIRIVKFSSGTDPVSAIAYAEESYRDNLGKWRVDRFAASAANGNEPKVKRLRITSV